MFGKQAVHGEHREGKVQKAKEKKMSLRDYLNLVL
jgi:hypothetical protein